ncbi:MAG: hypothetical protein GF329_08390 [Candidatus Lokiarchaeota archaeon]|nr:hypothetical protein [Candidatus Lokiarchaeota archaeon]
MENSKIYLDKLTKNIKSGVNSDLIEKFEKSLASIKNLMNQINEKNPIILKNYAKILSTDFENILNNFKDKLARNFSDNIPKSVNIQFNTPKDILKRIIKPKLEKVITELAEDNIWGISAYNEIVNDFKLRMQLKLAEELEKSLSGGKIEISQLDKDIAKKEIKMDLKSIEPEIVDLKNQLNDIKKFLESNKVINEVIIPKLNDFCITINKNFANIRRELVEKEQDMSSNSIDLINRIKEEFELFEEIRKKNNTLSTELERIKTELESSKEQIKEDSVNNQNKIQELENELLEKKQEIKRLQEELGNKNKSLEELNIKLEGLDKDKGSKIQILEEKLETKNQQLESLRNNLELKVNKISEIQEVKNEIISQKNELEEEIKALNSKISEQQNKLDETSNTLEIKQKKIIELQEVIQTSTDKKESLTNRVSELQNNTEALNSEVKSKRDRIDELTIDLKQKEQQLNESRTSKAELEKIKGDINKEKEDLIAKNATLNDAIAELKKEIENMHVKLDNKDQNIAELQNQKNIYDEKVGALEVKKDELMNKKSDLKIKLEDANHKIEELSSSVDSKTFKIKDLQEENSSLKQKNTESKISISKLENQINELKDEKDELTNDLESKNNKITELESLKDQAQRTNQLESEIQELLQFIENSPKYQLLYLINNLGETTFDKLMELFKFNEAITKTILDEFSDKGFIEISENKENPLISIKQKLNPLSSLNLQSVYENEALKNLAQYSENNNFYENFRSILNLAEKLMKGDEQKKEQAGYLISVLYLYIYESKNFHLLKKIRPYINKLNPNSFYVRLVHNLFTKNPWKSDIIAQKNAIIDISDLNVFSNNFNPLNPKDENYPKNGPFVIEKYRPASIFGWEEEINMKESALNEFSTITDLLKWIHLNGKGYSTIKIVLRNSNGHQYSIISSMNDKITRDTIINEFEITVD